MTFDEKVMKRIHKDSEGHWLWLGSYARDDRPVYGQARVSIRRYLMGKKRGRAVTPEQHVINVCGVPGCVNPDCCAVQGKMTAAMQSIKRNMELHRARSTMFARKRRNNLLDVNKAAHIRVSLEPRKVLAEQYGVHVSLIYRIQRGQAWIDSSVRGLI